MLTTAWKSKALLKAKLLCSPVDETSQLRGFFVSEYMFLIFYWCFMRFDYLLLVFGCLSLTACAHPSHLDIGYYARGIDASERGDWEEAEQAFKQAVVMANLRLPVKKDLVSAVSFELGRSKAKLCKFAEAEVMLTEALRAEAKVSGTNSTASFARMAALARVNDSKGTYTQAAQHYSDALGMAEVLQMSDTNTAGYVRLLQDYLRVLTAIRSRERAAEIELEVLLLVPLVPVEAVDPRAIVAVSQCS